MKYFMRKGETFRVTEVKSWFDVTYIVTSSRTNERATFQFPILFIRDKSRVALAMFLVTQSSKDFIGTLVGKEQLRYADKVLKKYGVL